MKNLVRITFGVAMSAVFLYFAFRGVDLHMLGQTIAHADPLFASLLAVGLLFVQLFRALRWQLLTDQFGTLPFRAHLRISNVGNMLIMLLPLRLGEFARPYLLQKAVGVPISAGLGAAFVERIVDGLVVTGLFYLTTALLGQSYPVPPALMFAARISLLIFVCAALVVALALRLGPRLPSLLFALGGRRFPAIHEKTVALIEAFMLGLRGIPSIRRLLGIFAYTLLYWVANALGMSALMVAFGWHLPVVAGFTVVCVLVIGIMIPAGPGLLGTYQAAIMTALGIFGIHRTDAAAYSSLAYLINLGVVLACGAPYLWGHNAPSLAGLSKVSTQPDSPA